MDLFQGPYRWPLTKAGLNCAHPHPHTFWATGPRSSRLHCSRVSWSGVWVYRGPTVVTLGFLTVMAVGATVPRCQGSVVLFSDIPKKKQKHELGLSPSVLWSTGGALQALVLIPVGVGLAPSRRCCHWVSGSGRQQGRGCA